MARSIKLSAIDKKWMAESDLDALKRAKEIMADKARLSAAQNVAKQQMQALGGIVNTKKNLPNKKK